MVRKLLILACLLLFAKADPVFAVTVSISNTPPSITDQPFNIDISVGGAKPGINYLRANLFPPGTTKYFGFTYNGTAFSNNSDYSQYLPITIDSSGNWNGAIQAKIDTDSSNYHGPGTYSLKVRRYTQSGSSYTWSNEVSLEVSLPTPPPTPNPTSTPVRTPTSTPSRTSTPAPKKLAASITPSTLPAPTSPASPISSHLPKISASPALKISSVAAAEISTTTSATPVQVSVKNQKQTNPAVWIGFFLIFTGAGLIGYIYFIKNAKIHF